MISRTKPTLFFTLFESQLIRSYLDSDTGTFFQSITSQYKLVVITSPSLLDFIMNRLLNLNVQADVVAVDLKFYRESRVAKVVGFFLRWNDKSPTTRRKIHADFLSGRNSLTNHIFRLTLHYAIPKFPFILNLLRQIYAHSIDLRNLWPEIQNLNDFERSTVFVSSLTNYWEDVPCGAYLKSLGCRVVGSVRSWDNLVSHGQIKFIPDVFLSHSKFMTDSAIKDQRMKSNKVFQWMTPTYRSQFLPEQKVKNSSARHVIYACMGISVNPDDLNFVQKLIEFSILLPSDLTITFLEHPKFDSNLEGVQLPKNIRRKSFPYESSSLIDYYNFLSSADLLICGGTTAALDSCFLGIKVAIVGYEIASQNYWISGLRYLDMAPHTSLLFKRAGLQIIKSDRELLAILRGTMEISNYISSQVSNFTGDSATDFIGIFINALKHDF